ncbi:MAG TPA: MaoC family dehydratase N-terminal domain-containing protein [Mycobacteriales bacterium]|nr:MaoC family dehydratase N-terminal domain-containing protein [Mycobacteriales bacterium]
MPLNRDFIGRDYPADETYEVSRELIRRFAEAVGDTNPAYVDVEAAKALGHPDVIAPPTFLTVLGFRYAGTGPMVDPSLGLDYSLVVHGEQRFVHHRPARAGDVLSVVSTIVDIRDAGRNELMTTKTSVSASGGEPVADLYSTIVSRGTAARAEA